MLASELGTETQNSTIAVCVNIPIENEAIIKGLGMEFSFKLCSIGSLIFFAGDNHCESDGTECGYPFSIDSPGAPDVIASTEMKAEAQPFSLISKSLIGERISATYS